MEYSLFDFIKLIGALGVFIYGMKIMSEAIQKIAGKSLRALLKVMTDNRFAGWLTGFIATALVQSSSATTVMVVSFVNAGLLSVTQSIGVIMGANFGTTVTGWLIALFGFSKFKITAYALPVVAVGVPLMFTSTKKWKSFGEFLLGFGLLFIGLDFMKQAVPDLKNNPEVLQFLSDFSDGGIFSVLLFILIGTILTFVVQSSSAAMSITLVMVAQGWVPFEVGSGMILGENIGTTITAYIASLVGNVNSKRAARAHMIFNVLGVVWMVVLLSPYLRMVDYFNMQWFGYGSVFSNDQVVVGEAMPKALSLFHSSFNVFNAILLIGFVKQIDRVVHWMVPDKKRERSSRISSVNQIVETPELAVLEAKHELSQLGKITCDMFDLLQKLYVVESKKFEKTLKKLKKNEQITDEIDLEISNFLIEVAQQNTSYETSDRIVNMIGVTNELESVADICYQSALVLDRKEELSLKFSVKMDQGIQDMLQLLSQAFLKMQDNLDKNINDIDLEGAQNIEDEINALRKDLKLQNLKRLEQKEEKLQTAILFRDLFNSLEKVGDKVLSVSQTLDGNR